MKVLIILLVIIFLLSNTLSMKIAQSQHAAGFGAFSFGRGSTINRDSSWTRLMRRNTIW
jgi:hypothetical protein